MNSKWKAKTLTLAVLSLGILFQPIALAYDPDAFPGKGNQTDFLKAKSFCEHGVSLLKQGKKQESLELFKKAVVNYPYCAAFHYNLGLGYSRLQDLSNALNSYKTAIKLAPDYAKPYSNISNVLYKMGDYKGAEVSAIKATELNESSPAAWINLAQAEIALKKTKAAKQHLQIARGLPNAEIYAADFTELSAKLQRPDLKTAEN